jgi:hypothetical protein
MGSLFTGSPQTATSYTTSSSETPKWMQDAIYNQVQLATNIANTPFQPYTKPLVAELSPLQQQAYSNIQANQGAWQPGMTAAQQGTQALSQAPGSFAAAQPYMQLAGQQSTNNIQDYMNPYTQNVTDQIAKLGARNLTENLLPGVSDSFIRAGQFGSGRMGEFGSRALRDTQESILNQQSGALQSGYTQAMGASQADLARQAALGQQAGSLTQADLAQRQSALTQMANMAQTGQALRTSDAATLEAAGAGQQQQQQQQLNAAYQQYQNELQYPKSQADWLSTQVRGMAPITPTTVTNTGSTTGATYSASPLSQAAAGLYTYKGLQSI